MIPIVRPLVLTLRTCFRSRVELQLELLALRQQIHILERSRRTRPRLSRADRVFWVWLSRVWTGWRRALIIVQPATVIAWHRQGFRWFWRWKSRRRTGRPPVPSNVRTLIRTMSEANPLWGAPRIHGELLKLGLAISQASVAKYMVCNRRPPSQSWRTFLTNHRSQLMAADFFVVPTVTYRLLFVLVLLAHDRRRIVHLAVTAHPTAAWTAQQLREACPWDAAPRYLIRDRDHAFDGLGTTATAMGIHEVLTAPGSPWQNAYVERFIGSVRRECLDHVLVFNALGAATPAAGLSSPLRTITNPSRARERHADSSSDHGRRRRGRRTGSRRPPSPIRTPNRLKALPSARPTRCTRDRDDVSPPVGRRSRERPVRRSRVRVAGNIVHAPPSPRVLRHSPFDSVRADFLVATTRLRACGAPSRAMLPVGRI